MIRIRKIDEVIGAERRCSNHTLLSFGVCVRDPLMNRNETKAELHRVFGKDNVRSWLAISPTRRDPNTSEDRMTVKEFIQENPTGHFVIFIYGHAMAVHNGVLVDTSHKGISRQRVDLVVIVENHDEQIEAAFEEYRNEYPQNVFTEPKKRKPKYRFTVQDIIGALEQKFGSRFSQSERKEWRRDLVDMARERGIGKRDEESGELLFSKAEAKSIFRVAVYVEKEKMGEMQERFINASKSMTDAYAEIFSNPTPKELRAAAYGESGDGLIRFIADARNETVYVFPADLLHMDAAKKIDRMLFEHAKNGGSRDVLLGTAIVEGSIASALELTTIDGVLVDGDVGLLPELGVFEDWSWVEKYIDGLQSIVEGYRESYEEEVEYGLV